MPLLLDSHNMHACARVDVCECVCVCVCVCVRARVCVRVCVRLALSYSVLSMCMSCTSQHPDSWRLRDGYATVRLDTVFFYLSKEEEEEKKRRKKKRHM